MDWDCGILAWDLGETFDHNHVEESEDDRIFNSPPHQTLEPVCQNVMTAEGVPLTCTGVAQVLPLCYHFGSAGSDLVQKGRSWHLLF